MHMQELYSNTSVCYKAPQLCKWKDIKREKNVFLLMLSLKQKSSWMGIS